jgi:hypothetical protein
MNRSHRPSRTSPKSRHQPPLWPLGLLLTLPALLSGCLGGQLRPLIGINQRLGQLGSSSEPALSGRWLALIAGRQGRQQVQLLDLERGLPVAMPGLNRPDSQPLSVAVDQQGERLAVVRQRDDRTELVLHRRSLMASQPIPIEPAGVPRRVSLSADGHLLAVEVSRSGLWQVDLLELP